MSKYLNPFTDFGFKKLFGEDSSKETLISFLNELLRTENVEIKELTYLNSEQLDSFHDDRKTFFDLYCKNEKGEHFIVEIQRQRHKNFKERMLYYSTYPIRNQSFKGEWRFELSAVFVIAILDFVLDESKHEDAISIVKLTNTKTFEVFYNKLTYVYIEIPKFSKQEKDLATHFDKWLFLISRMDRLERIPSSVKEQIFMKFLEQAELAKLSEPERQKYEYSLKVYRDNQLVLTSAREFGFEEGEAKGRAEGKAEGKAEIAKNLLHKGFDFPFIMETTGLSFDEIADLKAML